MRTSYQLHITGRVQGVGFRYSALQKARALNLDGYVQNLPDGSVKAVVSGEQNPVNDFNHWCRQGPSMARVEDVHVSDIPNWNKSGFEII